MWNKALDRMLDGFIVTGRLTLTYPDGATRRYGPGQGADVQITLCDPALPRRLVRAPELALGDGYVDGTLTLGGDDLDGFFTLVTQNAAHPPWGYAPSTCACADGAAGSIRQTRPIDRAPMWPITMTSRARFTIFSLMPTANIPAPISAIPA